MTDLALPGNASRFDYQVIDQPRHRLFVSHMADGNVDVVDLDGPRVVGVIQDVAAATGVQVAPDLGRLYASAAGADRLVIFDEDTLSPVARAKTGSFPDGVTYVAISSRVFVSDESGFDLTVIDARSGAEVGSVPLGGEAGNNAYDPITDRVFVAVQTLNQLVSVDPNRDRVLSRTHLSGCDHDHGLYIDPRARLAFVACDGNNRLLVVDLRTMAVTARFPLGSGPDVLGFDPGLKRLYVAAESGVVSVFEEADTGVRPLGRALLAANAHTVAVDPTTHRVYFPLRSVGGRPVLRVMEPA